MEAVDIGILQRMVVEKGRGSDWLLEKIIVKESSSSGTETLFMAQTWLKDRCDGKRSASITLDATGQHCLQSSAKKFKPNWRMQLYDLLLQTSYGLKYSSRILSLYRELVCVNTSCFSTT